VFGPKKNQSPFGLGIFCLFLAAAKNNSQAKWGLILFGPKHCPTQKKSQKITMPLVLDDSQHVRENQIYRGLYSLPPTPPIIPPPIPTLLPSYSNPSSLPLLYPPYPSYTYPLPLLPPLPPLPLLFYHIPTPTPPLALPLALLRIRALDALVLITSISISVAIPISN